ncbi:MAG: nucleoside triphosphate pyrophosphohydrolase [Ruminococcaceae bacterium]|nr:nucleoside triphosphate pyrophosphohydrolase [Oscillospiraceae bacterium]
MNSQFTEQKRKERISYLLAKERYDYEDLLLIVKILRGEGGCPWDMEQDHKSLRKDFIEETYEVIEAIDTESVKLLREELGDVLLQVVFHADIEREAGTFDMSDVSNDICAKLIHRHPHVFGEVSVKDSAEVLDNWDKIKGEEKQRNTLTDKLRSIPPMLPALMRAQKVGKKASFFDFETADLVFDKLYEEIEELREAAQNKSLEDVKEEMGDLLLTVTSLARKLGVDSEEALFGATNKFIDRFEKVENAVLSNGDRVENMTMEQLDAIWDKVKHSK